MDIRERGSGRRRRCAAAMALLVGITTALLGLTPVASAKPAPYPPNSCSGAGCGPT